MDARQPGEKCIYLYPNQQRGATLWYHDHDIPVMIRNSRFCTTGNMVLEWLDFFGRDAIIINGKPQPYLNIEARNYRFRFLDADSLGLFEQSLPTGDCFVRIGSDGGPLRNTQQAPA